MDELGTGIELAFAAFPQSPVFFQPSEAALDDPALGHDLESMQFIAPGDLHGDVFTQNGFDPLRKGIARITAITQYALHLPQMPHVAFPCLSCARSIPLIGGADRQRMGQAHRIDRNVALDARDFLARIIALVHRCVGVLHAEAPPLS